MNNGRSWVVGMGVAASVLFAGIAGAAPGKQAAKRLNGQVTAKAETTFDLQVRQKGAQQQVKVTVAEDTQFGKLEAGSTADLTEGYLLVVLGEREGDKVIATGVLRLAKLDGDVKKDDARNANAVATACAQRLAARAQRKVAEAGAADAAKPADAKQERGKRVVGKVVGVNPLSVQAAGGEKVEVRADETTKILRFSAAAFADITQGGTVVVTPKEGAQGDAVTAQSVWQMPAFRRGGKRAKKGQ